jgi:hypothetical protein
MDYEPEAGMLMIWPGRMLTLEFGQLFAPNRDPSETQNFLRMT